LLAAPLDNKVFFAGEAVSELSYGTLHGAYLSGQAAASRAFEHSRFPDSSQTKPDPGLRFQADRIG
jgi:flavin-dependent amine oxidoreductase